MHITEHKEEHVKYEILKPNDAVKPASDRGSTVSVYKYISLWRYSVNRARSVPSEVSKSQNIRHARQLGLLWKRDQFGAQPATYISHERQKRWTCMPSAGFKRQIRAIERLLVCSLYLTDAVILLVWIYGRKNLHCYIIRNWRALTYGESLFLSHTDIHTHTHTRTHASTHSTNYLLRRQILCSQVFSDFQ